MGIKKSVLFTNVHVGHTLEVHVDCRGSICIIPK